MTTDYDLVIAGGSIAGAALGFAAQRAGARVLIVERERTFRDRVRGESLHPWGVAEVHRLGLRQVLDQTPAQVARYWDTYVGGMRVDRRDLVATTASQLTGLNVHHPELQAALLAAAETAGAEVRRGEKVTAVEPGASVAVEIEGRVRSRVRARLAVVADGRDSSVRRQLGVRVRGEGSTMLTTGVLLEGVRCDDSTIGMFHPAEFGATALSIPLPRDRVRLYLIHRASGSQTGRGYSGQSQLPALVERCLHIGVPADTLSHARAIGPLATFDTTCWSIEPGDLPRGVVFLGDAAGNVDPLFGCGQSLALRDARSFVEHWQTCGGDLLLAAARYAADRRAYHAAQLRIEAWLTRILYTQGPAGEALRAATLPRLAELGIDLIGRGPDSPTDAAVEARLFAGLVSD